MYQRSNFSIVTKKYTDRSTLGHDRRNYILTFKIEVDRTSFLLVSKGVDFAPPKVDYYLSKVGKVMESGRDLVTSLRDVVEEYERSVKRKPHTKIQVISSGLPVVPGSTIKGASRSRLEYKFGPRPSQNTQQLYSCYSVEEVPKFNSFRHKRFWGDTNTWMRGTCKFNLNEDSDKICIVCDLFGTASLSSRVFFSDAVMQQDSVQRLNQIEVLKPGSTGELNVTIVNSTEVEAGLILLSLEVYSESPVNIGFWKYKYNPVVGSISNFGKYFGLVRFHLIKAKSTDGIHEEDLELNDFIAKTKEKLRSSEYNDGLDWNRGVFDAQGQ
jgi:hypothetical protein